ncbi:MAG TPA: hypothetical protein VKW06_16550 [Candidatus Angelobacter sp.]|nr:hypothetical protein [Candidatus Angelobacter sp.]
MVVSLENGAEQILERRRLEIIEPHAPGAAQPYHFVERLELAAAEKHLHSCTETSSRLAGEGIRQIVEALGSRGYRLRAAVILLSSGKPLPELPKTLASHALIHAAEGEFFRQAFRTAFASLEIPTIGIRERGLEEKAAAVFGRSAPAIMKRIAGAGRAVGPPWTTDQKTAALAAAIALAEA